MLRCASILCFLFLATSVDAGTITLEIRHLWDGAPVSIPSGEIETPAGEKVDFSRLAYLLSDPSLVSQGKRIGRKNWFAYVDAETEVSVLKLANVPAGSYSNLQLHIGLNEATDRSDPNLYSADHPLNPFVNNLHWSPQGGYIFLALEGHCTPQAFSYHLGNPRNRVALEIPIEFELHTAITIALDFHLDRIFDGTSPLLTQTQTSTHSREGDPLAALLKDRLSNVFSVREVKKSPVPKELSGTLDAPKNLVGTPYRFKLKKGFPIPSLPTDFPLTEERVELGRKLFHETSLSRSGTISCASCHDEKKAFTDGKQFSTGIDDKVGNRNSMPLFNLAWKNSFFWDGRAASLREQALMPIEDHTEMGHNLDELVSELSNHQNYPGEFSSAFGDAKITSERIGIAIEQFLLTLTSFDSKFDRAAEGEATLTEQEKRGFKLFMTEFDPRRGLHGADCFHCHGGAFFTDNRFHNNGLEPSDDLGLKQFTEKETDRSKFATPSLRNIAATAPYMHDGRFSTLEEVVEHYATGVRRSPTLDPNLAKHPDGGVPISPDDQAALVAFLKTLTDQRLDVSNSLSSAP
jgi:cytochrome c peroxidase